MIEEISIDKLVMPDISISQVANLLILTNQQQNVKSKKVKDLINHELIKSDLIERRIRHRLTAERYSVFDVLGRSDHEYSHSLFVRHLLDPKEDHDQGTVFLDGFLEAVYKLAKKQNVNIGEVFSNDWHKAWTRTELAHKDGRLDIVIELPGIACIVIENKIWALEQDRQLFRYGEWLENKKNNSKNDNYATALIFLTPKGHNSQTKETYQVINMSFGDLAEWLSNSLANIKPTAMPVISTVQQYIKLCKRLFTGNNIMIHTNQEIIELLKIPSNFETALNIRSYINEIDERTRIQFVANVKNILRDKLNSNIYSKWHISEKRNWNGYTIIIHFDEKTPEFIYGNIFHAKSWERQIGWNNPLEKVVFEDAGVKALVDKMEVDFGVIKNSTWYCHSNGDTDKRHIPTVNMSWDEMETKLEILNDNQNLAHPKAIELADAMWDLFSKFRVDIEKFASTTELMTNETQSL